MKRRIINFLPGRGARIVWGVAPFILVLMLYAAISALRLAENPNDKLLPGIAAFANALRRVALEQDPRTGQVLLWADTVSSLRRLGLGLSAATMMGLIFGTAIGIVPYLRATFSPLVTVLSMIPPMAVLPILFIVFGLDELSKVVLIIIGVTPFLIRDLALRIGALPDEMLIKAQSLGASSWQIIVRIIVPQMQPRLIEAVRLSLGPAWLFLISAEAIAATDGLGYRIFLMRRYLAMDVILPYVVWITLLALAMDRGLAAISRHFFAWAHEERS